MGLPRGSDAPVCITSPKVPAVPAFESQELPHSALGEFYFLSTAAFVGDWSPSKNYSRHSFVGLRNNRLYSASGTPEEPLAASSSFSRSRITIKLRRAVINALLLEGI